jgi:hypothetical protein
VNFINTDGWRSSDRWLTAGRCGQRAGSRQANVAAHRVEGHTPRLAHEPTLQLGTVKSMQEMSLRTYRA